mmetsp:Transcript_13716/g.20212  ORF Transcript_13716/g.20212 Transcript_13716/m.20212 type:complete len:253 (-) Transcript_13716:187-945(-)
MNRIIINFVTPLFAGTIIGCSTAFTPQSILAKATFVSTTSYNMPLFPQEHHVAEVVQTTVVNHDVVSWDDVLSSPSFALLAEDGGGAMDIIKNIALAITATLFLLAGLTQITASIIVPAATKELEKECKELAPELWDEYQLKLEPGQTMEQRPDLVQELGMKIQPLLDTKMERVFAEAKKEGVDMSEEERGWNAIGDMKRKVAPVTKAPAPAPVPSSPAEVIVELSNSNWDEVDPSIIDTEVIVKEDIDEKK